MESSKIKQVVDNFIEIGNDAILEVDVVNSVTGAIIESYNKDEHTATVFNELYDELEDTLDKAGFIKDLDYYYLELDNGNIWIIGKIGDDEYRYFVLIDSNKIKLGLFFKYLKELKEDE